MSLKKKNKDFDIDKYREHIVTSLTVLKSDVGHAREKLIELTSLLREQMVGLEKMNLILLAYLV